MGVAGVRAVFHALPGQGQDCDGNVRHGFRGFFGETQGDTGRQKDDFAPVPCGDGLAQGDEQGFLLPGEAASAGGGNELFSGRALFPPFRRQKITFL